MKIKGSRKKIIGAGVLLAGSLFFGIFAWSRNSASEGTQNVSAEPDGKEHVQNVPGEPDGQESAQDDVQIPLADIAVQCQIWERRYGKENTLPVEIFQDLQRYVARGECAEALSTYRQEELLCTVEEIKEVCPEFETLVDQYLKREFWETRLEANKIYRLESADDKPCFLLFYQCIDRDCIFLSTMLLKEGEEGWQITGNSGGGWGDVDDYEVFAVEQAGREVYYFLKAYNLERTSAMLNLARLSETFSVPLGGWSVRFIKTGVRPEFLFLETESELTSQVKEYVEDNFWFLAWMQQNGKPIWGDEDVQTHEEMREYFGGADVGPDQKWLIDIWNETVGPAQKWLIDFDGNAVAFQMAQSKDDSLLLEAYDREGNGEGTLLLSCRICFIQEAGVDKCTPAYSEAFDFNGLTFRNTEDNWIRDEVQERVWEEQQQRNIVPWQEESPFSEELYRLLREEAWTSLFGEENSLLESYKPDLTEDMEIFMQRAAETDWSKSVGKPSGDGECKWAYRWLEEDGSENFLSCIKYGNYTKDSIQWWKTGEGGLEEYDYIMEYEHPSQMICCGGRFYCMSEDFPEYRGGDVYVSIMEIGDSENWRTSAFSIQTRSYDDQDIACIPLYEEEGLSSEVKDYVQEWYEEIGKACEKISLFSGTEEKELTAEENRMLNSLSNGSMNLYANHRYFTCDIDNDGMVEYGQADWHGYLDATFYEQEKGEFRVISLEEVIPNLNGAAGSLAETAFLQQLWCEKFGNTTYLFTVEELAYSPDHILRIRVLREDYVEDKAVYLLKADMEESCWDWGILEITPSAEGVG